MVSDERASEARIAGQKSIGKEAEGNESVAMTLWLRNFFHYLATQKEYNHVQRHDEI